MSRSWKMSRKKSLLRCHYCHHHLWSSPGKKYFVVLFILLIGIVLLAIFFPFHVYFFVLFYLFSSLFTPPLLLLNLRWHHLDRSPSPSPWSHYWIMTIEYRHLELSATLSTYYGGITSLPMTLLPLLSQPIRYNDINYDRNYNGGSIDFPGFFLSQSCIS